MEDKILRLSPLEHAARIAPANIKRKIVTCVNVNNRFERSAPLTIERFRSALEKEND
jgi:hypothetical protein